MYLGTSFSSVTGNYAGTGTSATNASITLNTIGLAISVADFNSSAALNTSQSSLFQHTSATSAITSVAMNTSERAALQYTSANTKFAGILTTGITNGSATINSSQIQINLPAYLTTAMASNMTSVFQYTSNTSAITSNALNTSQSSLFQHTSATSAITANAMNTNERGNYQYTSNSSNNTSVYLAIGNSTAYQTATLSNTFFVASQTTKFAGTGTSATNATITLNSNGLAISVNSGGTGGGVAVKASGTYSQNTGTIEFANSNGLTFGLSDNGTLTASYDKGSVYFNNSNGITFGSSSDGISTSITASYNSTQFLTTAMASNASSLFAGINLTTGTTSDTDIKITLNTAGLNISYPKYLTTAPGTGSTITGASLTFNSAGINLSITHPQGSMYFINSNGHSFSSSSDGISTSVWIYTA